MKKTKKCIKNLILNIKIKDLQLLVIYRLIFIIYLCYMQKGINSYL